MKQGKRITCLLFAMLLLAGFAWSPLDAQAGASEIILDATTLEGNNWHRSDDTVTIKNGALLFSEEGTEDARFISKIVAQKENVCDYVAKLSAMLSFQKLPVGQSFILAFGLSGIESYSGEAGNVEVVFTNNNGLKVGITAYDQDGEAVVVSSSKSAGMSFNKATKIQVLIETNGNIAVQSNGRVVCSGKLPVSAAGRVGLMQTGGIVAKVENLEVICYQYARPENVDIYEDFEKKDINTAQLTARSLVKYDMAQSGQRIEEYNGSNVLMMRNVSHTYVGTALPYSNFELTFDVPYMNVDKVYDEDGKLQGIKQTDFVVSFGAEASDTLTYSGWETAAESVIYSDGKVYSYNYPEEYQGSLNKNPFAEGKPFSVKVSMVDGVVTASIKWMDETEFQTVITYRRKTGTPEGYVQIWTTKRGNFAIDNLKIKNLDDNPKLIETEVTTGWEKPADFVYEPAEPVYVDSKTQDTQPGIYQWYLMIPATAVLGGIAMAITFAVTEKKRRREKTHEN